MHILKGVGAYPWGCRGSHYTLGA